MVEGIAMWRKLGDLRFIALGLNFISPFAIGQGRVDEAQAFLEESLALSTRVGDRWGLGTAYRYLGVAARSQAETLSLAVIVEQALESPHTVAQ